MRLPRCWWPRAHGERVTLRFTWRRSPACRFARRAPRTECETGMGLWVDFGPDKMAQSDRARPGLVEEPVGDGPAATPGYAARSRCVSARGDEFRPNMRRKTQRRRLFIRHRAVPRWMRWWTCPRMPGGEPHPGQALGRAPGSRPSEAPRSPGGYRPRRAVRARRRRPRGGGGGRIDQFVASLSARARARRSNADLPRGVRRRSIRARPLGQPATAVGGPRQSSSRSNCVGLHLAGNVP